MKLNKIYGLLLASVIVVAAPVHAQQTEMSETNQNSAQGMDKGMSKGMNMGTDSMKNMPRQEDMNPAAMKMQMNDQNRHPMNPGADTPENNKQ